MPYLKKTYLEFFFAKKENSLLNHGDYCNRSDTTNESLEEQTSYLELSYSPKHKKNENK